MKLLSEAPPPLKVILPCRATEAVAVTPRENPDPNGQAATREKFGLAEMAGVDFLLQLDV